MPQAYSFLQDQIAVHEIRKHQWIESEKFGYPIGFATAAVDWINQFGENFLRHRLAKENNEEPLLERRRYRRFSVKFPIQLQIGVETFCGLTEDLSLLGVSCLLPAFIAADQEAQVLLILPNRDAKPFPSQFQFVSRFLKTQPVGSYPNTLCYKAFVPFSETVRDFFRFNQKFFANQLNLAG